MYTIMEVVELGKAQELIRSILKVWLMFDDFEYLSLWLDLDPPWD